MQNQPPMPSGSLIEPAGATPFAPPAPGEVPLNTGTSLTSQHMAPAEAHPHRSILETLILIIVTIVAIVFIYLYINMYGQWDAAKTDVDGQINAAVALKEAQVTTELEEQFAEREKLPYDEFQGPADYGSVHFEYPRTWSVYVARDAANGGDFESYFNPGQVNPVSNQTINALRFFIRDASFDSVIRNYENLVKNQKVEFTTRNIGGILANLYVGELANGIQGAAAVFKLRDKTVILQTDAAIFLSDYDKILNSITLIP